MELTEIFSFIYMSKSFIEKDTEVICKEYKLTTSSLSLLLFLAHFPDLNTSKQICKFGGLKRGNVSVLVEILTKRGFIKQETDEKDRRIKYLFLTDKSTKIIEKVDVIHEKYKKVIKSNISEEDLNICEKVFLQMYKNIKENSNN